MTNTSTQISPQILQGHVVALFAFDLGYEVSLEQLSALPGVTLAQPLSPKKRTPAYLQYIRPPRVLSLGVAEGGLPVAGIIQATVFEFGAVSIAYRWPLTAQLLDGATTLQVSDLPQVSQQLYALKLEKHARELMLNLIEKLRPAITRPLLAELVEDYYLFVIEKFAADWRAADLLAQQRTPLAQTLRFETGPLSGEQQSEALSHSLSYYENDLVLVDWNAAIICDRDFEDTVSVLELLNVELLEARYIDAQLDGYIANYSRLARHQREWPWPLRLPYKKAIQELSELRVESSLLAERVDNALKLIGDLYLARLYASAARRFYLHEWERVIAHKLDLISEFYQLLTDRVREAQSQTLELVIILLILVELIMGLMKLM